MLDDQKGLHEAWERDGYRFFRDVLDKQVIAEIRRTYLAYLVEMGLTEPGDPEFRYNGKGYAHLPAFSEVPDNYVSGIEAIATCEGDLVLNLRPIS